MKYLRDENSIISRAASLVRNRNNPYEIIDYDNSQMNYRQRLEYSLEQVNSMRIIKHNDGLQIQISLAQREHLEYHEALNYRSISGNSCPEYCEEDENTDTERICCTDVGDGMSGRNNVNTNRKLLS